MSSKYNPENIQYADFEYQKLLNKLVLKVEAKGSAPERTGTGATNIFGAQMRFDLQHGFPILTTKAVHWHSIVTELLWFLRGDTNIQYLIQNNVHIWTDWPLKKFNEHRIELGKREVSAQEFEECIRTDDDFAESWGDIGKAYGHQWRNFGQVKLQDVDPCLAAERPDWDNTDVIASGFDQIQWVINEIKTNPTSRRLIVTGWNPHEVDKAALPPCHTLFQFFVEPIDNDARALWVDKYYPGNRRGLVDDYRRKVGDAEYASQKEKFDMPTIFVWMMDAFNVPKGKLSCQLYQRSADFFLGVPFNIASYALLTHIVAAECGLEVGEFIWTGGVVHLYSNHLEQAKIQLERMPGNTPRLKEFVPMPFDQYNPDDFQLENYHPKDRIPAPVAV